MTLLDTGARPSRRALGALGALGVAALVLALVAGTAAGAGTGAGAGVPHLDPAALPRGADPAVAHLVHDTIHDGALRVPATRRGAHDALWVVAGGYVVRDYNVGPRRLVRVVHVDASGRRREIARSRQWIDVSVSDDGTRLTYTRPSSTGRQRSVVTVQAARTGRVLAHRELRLVTLVAVTRSRVLLARRLHWRDPATVWWSYRQGRVRRIYDQAATSADVGHDKVVLDRPAGGEFCFRVAVLSEPDRTLWRGCSRYPHRWSPDGRHVLSTWTYFDAAGTDRWWVARGRTGARLARITGRLDWTAVWEDDQHFLTLAQSDGGEAAIIRCDRAGTCERASRVWDVPLPAEPSLYYSAPPVVLADR